MRSIGIVIIVLLNALSAFSQEMDRAKEINKFFKFCSRKIDVRNSFKDSVAFYTCNIAITVDSANKFKPVISSTNTKVSDKIKKLDVLKSYNYRKMIGGSKKVKFILPISIVIIDARYGERYIDAHSVFNKVATLFYYPSKEDDDYKLVYLRPLNNMVDMKKYK